MIRIRRKFRRKANELERMNDEDHEDNVITSIRLSVK